MANNFYNNARTLQPGQTARSDAVEDKFDDVAVGFDTAQVETNRAIKLPDGSREIVETAVNRANQVIGFDANGNVQIQPGVGNWRGDWATATAYKIRDVVRDATSKNLYIAQIDHTSGTLSTDITDGKFVLMVNVVDVENAKAAAQAAQAAAEAARDTAETHKNAAAASETNAANSEAAAATSETNAATSETNAATSATNAANSATTASGHETKASKWADEAEDITVETGKYSAKHHSAKAATSATNAANSASALAMPDPAVADTYLRRNTLNDAYVAKTPTEVANELSPLIAQQQANTYLRRNAANSAYETKTITDVLNELKTVDGAGSGLDADMVDGIQANALLKTYAMYDASGDTLPSETPSDWYTGTWLNNTTGAPEGMTHGRILGHTDPANLYGYSFQIARGHSGSYLYLRVANSSAWSPWQRIVTFDPAENPWIAPTLTNGWVNHSAAESSAGYYKDKQGTVWLKGLVKDGTVGVDIFVLPSGYRPPNTARIPVISNGAFGYVYVTNGGSVVLQSGSNLSVDLAAVAFRT